VGLARKGYPDSGELAQIRRHVANVGRNENKR